ncbi:hypothetical protein APT73_11495, partial [Klebsiella pneumoniae]
MRLRNKSCRLLGIGAITLRHIGCRRRCLLRDKNMVQDGARRRSGPVSYTHLTLPTILRVYGSSLSGGGNKTQESK